MSRLDKFRFQQQVPDIESNDASDDEVSEQKQVKAEAILTPGQRVKEYLLNHHQKDFFSAIIDQENAGFKQFLDVNWMFLQSLHPSVDIQEICVEILQELTKSKFNVEEANNLAIKLNKAIRSLERELASTDK
jgi:hypothetical protein